jgi:Rrf2 family iron-sulfur cluster assembly transcriptional regulator
MRLTTKSRYGARAIFDIAYNSSGAPVQIKDIAVRQQIPQRYLEQIFHKLKQAKVVKSVRGPGGGYLLAKEPAKITLTEIIRAMREPIDPVFCAENGSGSVKKCARLEECVTQGIWKEAGEKITAYFDSITVADLCQRAQGMGLKKKTQHRFDYSI